VTRVVVVGAGFGGVAAAIELARHGISDVTVLDAAAEPGGTWLHNTYPGAACDVPSHFYSFSYAQRRDWTRLCSPQSEILGYLQEVVREFDVTKQLVLDTHVSSCAWSDESGTWTVTAADGRTWEAEAVVLATGQLNQPKIPAIEGIDEFDGHAFHSARWDHEHDLRGHRVAVIGSGASAVQFVPEVAKQAGHLAVFQRSGNWFLPRVNRPYPGWVKAAIKHVPGLQAYRRRFMTEYCEALTASIRNPGTLGQFLGKRSARFMRSQLKDPAVLAKAWPDYTFGCKRVLFSSHYLPALQRPNVDLVTDAITRIRPEGVETADGVVHAVDTIIWATGFATLDFMFPMEVTGAGGRSLREAWADGPHAHLGMTVPGFPSMFVMYGPNTNTSGGSIIYYLEKQAAYLRQAIEAMLERGARSVAVRADVEAASDRKLQARFPGTAWTRCDSWYRDRTGRIVTNWPGYMREYARATERFDPAEYEFS
jgi:cation diffusion facilitator CzcD-associated flavoprotein CzcO